MSKIEKQEPVINEDVMNKAFHSLKDAYMNIDIPEDLEFKIRRPFKVANKKQSRMKIMKSVVGIAAVFSIFTATLNLNQSFAMAMSELPVIGQIVKVLSFRFDVIETENVHANIEAPVITGLENKELESALNEKYFEENKALYDVFKADMDEIEAQGGHLGIDSGFDVKTDTERILSIGRYYVNTVGSSSTTMTYDTIDKIDGIMITLPSLFIDDSYIEVISSYLIERMKNEMKEDTSKAYWVLEDDFEPFTAIDANQNFYLTADGKLVISFDKYVVAPGYMGVVEFEIPTEVIADILVSDTYVN